MEGYDGMSEPVIPSPVGRKCSLNKHMHQKEISKRIRHPGGGEIPSIACQHRKAVHAGLCHADQLNWDDLALNHAKFYSTANKVKQDDALLKLMTISSSKRQRVSEGDRQKPRNVIVKYSLFTNNRAFNFLIYFACHVNPLYSWP